MSQADDYNRLIGDHNNPLVKGMDAAIADINAEPYTVAQRHADELNAERWAAIEQASKMVSHFGVVVPTAVAEKLVSVLKGNDEGAFTAELLASMIEGYIAKQQER
jgi:hypothetical protein